VNGLFGAQSLTNKHAFQTGEGIHLSFL